MEQYYLDEGLDLFEKGDYFMAHETLEEYWVEAPEAERDFLQGLIHLAVGFHHHEKANFKGAKLQFAKARSRLSAYGDDDFGVDLAAARRFLEEAPRLIEDGVPLAPPKLRRVG